MLVKLLPSQIVDHWELIKLSIRNSLPSVKGESEDKMNNILSLLLSDNMDCWISMSEKDEVDAVLITRITFDEPSEIKNLLIYCIEGFGASRKSWSVGMEQLRKYAGSKGCHRVITYSNVPAAIKWFERLGGNVEYTLISVPAL